MSEANPRWQDHDPERREELEAENAKLKKENEKYRTIQATRIMKTCRVCGEYEALLQKTADTINAFNNLRQDVDMAKYMIGLKDLLSVEQEITEALEE